MTRRLLLAAGGTAPTDPGGGLPPDPTLTEPRQFTDVVGTNQNTSAVDGSGKTWRTTHQVRADSASLRIAFSTHAQGATSDPVTLGVTVELADGTLLPLAFAGQPLATIPAASVVESDPLTRLIPEGVPFHLRTYAPPGQTINTGRIATEATMMAGDHRTGTWTPEGFPGMESPIPIAFIGACRPATISPAVLGDSISARAAWWSAALDAHDLPGLEYGRNATRFTDTDDGRMGDTLRAATHLLVQFGVNDLGPGTLTADLWDDAVACYTHADSLNPGIPIWQTTPTPEVDIVGNNGGTLEGQTLDAGLNAARQAWIAFLRDGAPCHPTTKAALSVGATGTVIRAGHTDHPLRGIVDIAAAVEHGGSSSPTGKWRIDLGALINNGDGTHPNSAGQAAMTPPVQAWAGSLT